MMDQRDRGNLTTLAFCWNVERRDGAGIALTSHDCHLRIGDVDYSVGSGLMPNAVQDGSLDQPLAELACSLDSTALTAPDLHSGRWDDARATLAAADWSNGKRVAELCQGEIGEVIVEGEQFTVDFRGAGRRLAQPVCPTTSPECRATLGDKSCRVDLAGRRLRSKVIEAAGSRITFDQELGSELYLGTLRWLSGQNCGLQTQIVQVEGASIQLRQAPAFQVQAGDVASLLEGCDKRLQTCRDRFRNVVNFRGEPHLPGGDFLTRYPGV